jgi:thiol-disulfide isomerase/thioredoxin
VEPDDYDSAGLGLSYEEFKGRYLLINYWAEWCGPCLEEIPELNKLAEEHSQMISVIGVNYDGLSAEELLSQQQSLGINFRVVQTDPAARLNYELPEVLPTSYLFDTQQNLVATLVGPQTSESILELVEK